MHKKQTHSIQQLYATYDALRDDTTITINGWIRTNRLSGSIGFLEINDGSGFKPLQAVYNKADLADFDELSKCGTGSAVSLSGKLVATPTMKQPFELHVHAFMIVGKAIETYPLQKKRHGFDFLREIAHLRPRTNTFTAVYRLRSVVAMAINQFFFEREFVYVHTPILTGNDAEGAGQAFKVIVDPKDPDGFFKRQASLTVSGQLHVEAFSEAFKKVYTFGPTFRAEPSNTTRHASEFWMIEPEISFANLNDDMELIEACIRYVIDFTLKHCPAEMAFFNQFIDPQLLQRLENVRNKPFARLTYTKAIEELQKAVKNGIQFEKTTIEWGMDLQTEHERYLSEKLIQGPVFITDYPKDIKAFYMRLNDDQKTVAACDLLVPGVGELVGGSQREERYELLKARMEHEGNLEELGWYLELRQFGGTPHAGFGIGFDRLLMYLTGMTNIRDVQPYPRTPGGLLY